MTDGGFDEPDFDDPAYAGLEELLASAKVQGSIPADVAARLDATLAGLTGTAPAEPLVPEEDEDVVVPLRRRPRWVPRLLAAAAVVVVAGAGALGLNGVLENSNGSSDDSSSTAVPGVKADAGGDTAPLTPTAGTPETAQRHTTSGARGTSVLLMTKAGFADEAAGLEFSTTGALRDRAHPGSFFSSQQLRRAPKDSVTSPDPATTSTARPPVPTSAGSQKTGEKALTSGALTALASCSGPPITGTTTYPVVLDSQPAVLVVHPANAGTRLLEAWSCDGSRVLAFTTVPA